MLNGAFRAGFYQTYWDIHLNVRPRRRKTSDPVIQWSIFVLEQPGGGRPSRGHAAGFGQLHGADVQPPRREQCKKGMPHNHLLGKDLRKIGLPGHRYFLPFHTLAAQAV